nr:hypothetical protein [Tanacetum cinerariifolium]
MRDTIAQTRSENVSKFSNYSLLIGVNTPRSDEDSLKLKKLMELSTNLKNRVLDLDTIKTTQAMEIESLKRKDAVKQGRKIHDIDVDEDITLVNDQDDEQMFDVNDLQGKEVFVQEDVLIKSSLLMLHRLMLMKSQDKGKAIMIEEPMKLKKKDQIMLDEEVALKLQAELQAEFDKEQRLASKKAQQEEELNSPLNKKWNDIQVNIDTNYQLAQRLQAEEQEELTDEEKARLFVQFLKKRRKFFAAKRAEEKRIRPLTRAQQRSIMTELVVESSKEAEAEVTKGTTSGGGPWCQETMGDTISHTRFERVSKLFNDSLLARGNTLQSDDDRIKLDELMALCTTLQTRVLNLEKTKTTQQMKIDSLKKRVKKLKKRNRSRTHNLKRLYKVGLIARVESSRDEQDLGEDASKQERRIHDIDADEDITLVNVQDDDEMFDVDALAGEEVFVAK